MHKQSILPEVLKLLLNSNIDALDLTKQEKLFQISKPLKCTEFIPYTVDFADGSNREGPFLRLYDKFLVLKQDYINLGFVLDTLENFNDQKP